MKKKEKNNSNRHNLVPAIIAALVTSIMVFISITVTRNISQSGSIPVVLSYDGTFWIDQNSDTMSDFAAKKFLRRNPNYARDILYLNGNECYATILQNSQRSHVLDDLHTELVYNTLSKDDRDIDVCLEALHSIASDPPSQAAFSKLLAHVGNNAARFTIEKLQSFCDKGGASSVKEDAIVHYVFFGVLAKYYDSENLGAICGAPTNLTSQVPVLLSADGETWLDQNGKAMEYSSAINFLVRNQAYASGILWYNQNQYYLDTWQNDKRSAEIQSLHRHIIAIHWDDTDDIDYTSILTNMVNDPPSSDTLAQYRGKLRSNIADDDIKELNIYINDGGTVSNIHACIFWCAVAKATEDGTFETSFETTAKKVVNPSANAVVEIGAFKDAAEVITEAAKAAIKPSESVADERPTIRRIPKKKSSSTWPQTQDMRGGMQ